jgi:hypothetical protein
MERNKQIQRVRKKERETETDNEKELERQNMRNGGREVGRKRERESLKKIIVQ